MIKGKTMYVPSIVLEEIKEIKIDDDIVIGTEAFRKLAKYAKIGREAQKDPNFRIPNMPIEGRLRIKRQGNNVFEGGLF